MGIEHLGPVLVRTTINQWQSNCRGLMVKNVCPTIYCAFCGALHSQ